jgi:2-isopropylmalate synthase
MAKDNLTNNNSGREKIIFYDTTLRDGEQAPGNRMNQKEKLKVARALEAMNVDIIEAGFPGSSHGEWEAVHNIAMKIEGPQISGLARCVEKDIIDAGTAIEPAVRRGRGKIHVFIATSPVHRDKKLRKSKEGIIEMAVSGIKLARQYTDLVEFSCEDFGRTESDYTVEVVREAIIAGATTINLPDTVGYRFPTEIEGMVREVIDRTSDVSKGRVMFSMHAHDDLGNASVNTLYAILGGARQVEVTVNGIGERAGNSALEKVIAGIVERPDFFPGIYSDLDTTKIKDLSNLISSITGHEPQQNSPIVGRNAFKHSSGIHQHGVNKDKETYEWISPERYGSKGEMPLSARSGKDQVRITLESKGISFDRGNLEEIMERFKILADSLNEVYDDTLVMAARGDSNIPEHYRLVDFSPSLEGDKGCARMSLMSGRFPTFVVGKGNGMIAAAEDAINAATGLHLNIVDYNSRSASPGAHAQGIETVVVRNNGYTVMGRGIDYDTVRGAAKALIDASNRMRYVLGNK